MAKGGRQIRIEANTNQAVQALAALEKHMESSNALFKMMARQSVNTNKNLRTLSDRVEQLAKATENAARKTDKAKMSFFKFWKQIGAMTGVFLSLRAVMQRIGNTIRSVSSWIGGSTQEFAALSSRMKVAASVAGSTAEQWEFLNKTAAQFGMNVMDLGKSFTGFAVAAVGMEKADIEQIFTGASAASRALGLTADETRGVFKALEQMMSKGKITAEELRGQLGERLPGAMQLMAKSANVSLGELEEMMKAGTLLAKDVLPEFGRQLAGKYWDQAIEMSNTMDAQLQLMKGNWTQVGALIGQKLQPLFIEFFKGINKMLLSIINNWEKWEPLIQLLGEGLKKFFAMVLDGFSAMAEGISFATGMLSKIGNNPWLNAAAKKLTGIDFRPIAEGMSEASLAAERLANTASSAADKVRNVDLNATSAENSLWGVGDSAADAAGSLEDLGDAIKDVPMDAHVRAWEEYTDALDAYRRVFDPLYSAEKEMIEQLDILNTALDQGAISWAQYAAGVKKVEDAYEEAVQKIKEEQLQDVLDQTLDELVAEIELTFIVEMETSRTFRDIEKLGKGLGGLGKDMRKLADSMAEVNPEIGRLMQSFAQLLESLENVSKAGANFDKVIADSDGKIDASAGRWKQLQQAVGSGSAEATSAAVGYWTAVVQLAVAAIGIVKSALQALGVSDFTGDLGSTSFGLSGGSPWGGTRGVGGDYGGIELGGDYADDGAAYGAAAGSIAGAIVGGIIGSVIPVFGTMIGAAIGAYLGEMLGEALGGLLGGLINRGKTDMRLVFNELTGEMGGTFNMEIEQLDDEAKDLSSAIGKFVSTTIDNFANMFGLMPVDLGDAILDMRGDVIEVWVNGMYKTFDDMEEALDFMITGILQSTTWEGGAPEIIAALKNSNAQTMEELAEDLDFAWLVREMNVGEFLVSLEKLAMEFAALEARAEQLGQDVSTVQKGFFDELLSTHNELLGIEENTLEKRKQQAMQFNEFLQQMLDAGRITMEQFNDLWVDPTKVTGGGGRGPGHAARRQQFWDAVTGTVNPMTQLTQWYEEQQEEIKKIFHNTDDLAAAQAALNEEYETQKDIIENDLKGSWADVMQWFVDNAEAIGLDKDSPEYAQMVHDITKLRWEMEIFNMQLMIDMLYEAGRLTDEQYANYQAWLEAASNWNPPDYGSTGGGGGGGGGGNGPGGQAPTNTAWYGAGNYFYWGEEDMWWPVSGNRIYDLKKWLDDHPGQAPMLATYGSAPERPPSTGTGGGGGGGGGVTPSTPEFSWSVGNYRSFAELNEDYFAILAEMQEAWSGSQLTEGMKELEEAFYEAAEAVWDYLMEPLRRIADQIIGDVSNPFNASKHFQMTMDKFNELASAALGGDENALMALPDIINQLMQAGGQALGIGGQAALDQMILDLIAMLEESGITFDPEAGYGYENPNAAAFAAALEPQVAATYAVRDEIRGLRDDMARANNQTI